MFTGFFKRTFDQLVLQNMFLGFFKLWFWLLQGYRPTVFYPVKSNMSSICDSLSRQCESLDLPFLSYFPSESHLIQDSYNLVVDALFGFRFKPPVKDTFASVIETLKKVEIPICSVDVPSGISHDRFWKISLLFFIDCLISSYVLLIFSCCFKGRFNFQFFLNDKY